ncbi:hypothetical protein [Singulisphaera sp. GP187]|uniref:hypothetical protein n=1 Tax=Singulisphaera sp. GP187 TaxID=1882752 RepID=UPI000941160B|nr:hypothetical protein [Singulisphaera sp. GP187]
MRLRFFLATLLSLPCLALVGCGGSPSSPNATVEASTAPLSAADVAKAEDELKQATDGERAQQSQNLAGKKNGQNR